MRTVIGLIGVAALLMGCENGGQYPIGLGTGDPTQQTNSSGAPDGLQQYVSVTGPSASTGTGGTNEVIISTWLYNGTANTITAVVRACALQPSDFQNAPVQLVAPDQATCGDSAQTVVLAPFQSTATLSDTYPWSAPAGSYTVLVRMLLQPEYWASVTIGGGS